MSSLESYRNFLNSQKYQNILSYSERQLEADHSFIQWLFPLTVQSMFNGNSPVINLKELRESEDFQMMKDNMLTSLNLMLDHWGLSLDNNEIKVVNMKKMKYFYGHNALRLSRVIQSLIYHDHKDIASNLLVKATMFHHNEIWSIRYHEAIDAVSSL